MALTLDPIVARMAMAISGSQTFVSDEYGSVYRRYYS